ncbi:MAG: hypothetical protein WBO74_03525 [Thermoanaerobaculia bacterium]
MSKDQRQKVLLGVLLVLMLVAVWRVFGPRITAGSGSKESGNRSQAAERGTVRSVVDSPGVVELRLEDLEKVAGRFRPGRDPFRFGEARTLEAEPTEDEDDEAARAAAAQEALRRAMEAQRRQEAAVSGRPVLPDFDLKFLGSFGSRQKRLAVFSDGAEIFNALEGGVLKSHFVIRQIGLESVDVGYLDYPDEPAIRLAAGG